MSASLCPNCGARFSETTPGTHARCAFCHTSTYIPKYGQRSAAEEPVEPRRSSAAGGVVAVVAVMVFLGGAVAFLFLARSVPRRPPPPDAYQEAMDQQKKAMADMERLRTQAMQQASDAMARAQEASGVGRDGKPALTLATLSTAPFNGRKPLEAPGMVGTLEAFDVVANIEWVRTIGRAWTEDAALERLAVDRVAADGTVNLKTIPSSSAWYRFVSPRRVKEYLESASVTVPQVNYELFVFVDAHGLWVQKITGDASHQGDVKTFASLPACTLAKAFDALKAAHQLPERPVYNVDFYGYGQRASWKFETLTGQPRIPSVRGMACTVE